MTSTNLTPLVGGDIESGGDGSLECVPCGGFLNIKEFRRMKSDNGRCEKVLMFGRSSGSRKAGNGWAIFLFPEVRGLLGRFRWS